MTLMDRWTRFWAKVDRSGDCWLYQGHVLKDGYGQFGATGERRAHRVSWELTHGPIPEGMQVLHHCDVPLCVRPTHLYLGDHAQNMRDRDERGRTASGERSWLKHHGHRNGPGEATNTHKLTVDQVLEIRQLYAPNPQRGPVRWSQRALARRFGVTQQTISKIVRGERWDERAGAGVPTPPPAALLPPEVRAEIAERYRDGEASQQALADEYGIGQTTVSRIVRKGR
jgi:DNA-binding MarR family transcriptional regulator